MLFFKEKLVAKRTSFFVVADIDKHILTLNSGDRNWLPFIDKVKLYRHRSKDFNHSHKKINKSNGDHDYFRELNAIFGSWEIASNHSSTISVDEFIVKILTPDNSLENEAGFVKPKKNERFTVYRQGRYGKL